jgi:iron complex outermembrane receptor protein
MSSYRADVSISNHLEVRQMAQTGRIGAAFLAVLLWTVTLSAQGPSGTVMGRVVDETTGQPLSGVTVSVGERSALSGTDGRFIVTAAPAGPQTVRATRIGYREVTRSVTVTLGESVTVDISMIADAVALEGLVVIGYGAQREGDLTGAIETVTPEEFNTGRLVSPEQLIQGKVAGVQVIDTGEPGGGISLRIRGGASVNASNEPLFVLDGIPLAVGGGLSAGRNPLNFINPNDIARITVLKDASSTAIYGSRGANGVVIIETRSGLGEPQFVYSTSLSTSRITGELDLLTADQFRTVVAEYAPDRMTYLGNANTDWRGAVERSATGQEHALAVAGAGQNMNYRLSLGYLDQEGVILGSRTERVSAALNYNHRLLDDRLNVRASLRGARSDDQFTPGGVLGSATSFDPTQPIRTEAGYFEQTEFTLGPNNPVAELALAVEDGTTYRTVGNVEGEYRMPFLEALAATMRVGYDVAQSERRGFFPSTLQSQVESATPGAVSRSNPTETTGIIETFLNYGTRFDRLKGDLDATAGYSYESTEGDYPFFQARGLSSDLLGPDGVPTAEEQETRLSVRESKLASFFGRVNYTLLDRYLLTLSVRRDGSSRFGPADQWGTFPAAALAWRISDESFTEGVDWLSDLKLRASWGVNGNQAIGDYLWVSAYQYSDAFARVQFGDEFVTTIRPTAVDPNIKWEETTSYNLGLDYGLFGNRLSGSVEYYFKNTDDLIFRIPVAAGTNLSNYVTTNIGEVENRGVEFNLNALVFDGGQNGFTWDAGFNASTNRNKLVRVNPFGGGSEQILVGGIAGGVGSNIQVLQPGYAINSFFVYRHKRDADGNPVSSGDLIDMYEDVNGDGIINQNDRAPFENPAPNWILGHTSRIGYGNVDFGFTLRAHLGNHVYDNVGSSQGYYNRLNEAAGPVNLHASVLENEFVESQFFSDVYVEDASFLKMDNVTLGYTFRGLGAVQGMRLFGTVQNVLTLTGYSGIDPTAGLNGIDNNIYPRSRTFTLGASVGF